MKYNINIPDDILLAIEPIANDNAIIVFEMANDSEYSENIGSLYLKKEKNNLDFSSRPAF